MVVNCLTKEKRYISCIIDKNNNITEVTTQLLLENI